MRSGVLLEPIWSFLLQLCMTNLIPTYLDELAYDDYYRTLPKLLSSVAILFRLRKSFSTPAKLRTLHVWNCGSYDTRRQLLYQDWRGEDVEGSHVPARVYLFCWTNIDQ